MDRGHDAAWFPGRGRNRRDTGAHGGLRPSCRRRAATSVRPLLRCDARRRRCPCVPRPRESGGACGDRKLLHPPARGVALGDTPQFHRGLLAGGLMNGFKIKGWCPSALRPMASGDGLVVRLRPRGGRLSRVQASAIANLSNRYGNGLIDLTGRANLQIRGVVAESHEALIEALARLGLIDADAETESRRNILVAPFWSEGDDTPLLAAELERALATRQLGLPEKFGFSVDCGAERVLAQALADIRIERGANGGLLVRADGAQEGRAVTKAEAVDVALALARWFVISGGASDGRGRMAAHIASGMTIPDAIAANAK